METQILRMKRKATMHRFVIVLVTFVALVRPAVTHAQTNETVTYFQLDAIGSVRMITDASGQVVQRHDFLPFGTEWLPPPPTEPMLFTAKEHDGETAFDYSGARYYGALTGRFTTVDPGHVAGDVFNPQTWNAYAYALNNPLRYVDPGGYYASDCPNGTIDTGGACERASDLQFEWNSALFAWLGSADGGGVGDSPNPQAPNCSARPGAQNRLHPTVQAMADQLLAQLSQRGIDVRFGDTFRTYLQQDQLFALGRTRPGRIVTNARGGQSIHNFGLAFDIRIYDANGKYIGDGSNQLYKTAGTMGQAIGLEWGGSWSSPYDPSHFEYRGGRTLRALRAAFEAGQDVLCSR